MSLMWEQSFLWLPGTPIQFQVSVLKSLHSPCGLVHSADTFSDIYSLLVFEIGCRNLRKLAIATIVNGQGALKMQLDFYFRKSLYLAMD